MLFALNGLNWFSQKNCQLFICFFIDVQTLLQMHTPVVWWYNSSAMLS